MYPTMPPLTTMEKKNIYIPKTLFAKPKKLIERSQVLKACVLKFLPYSTSRAKDMLIQVILTLVSIHRTKKEKESVMV